MSSIDQLIIRDDFYSDPDLIRQRALNKQYHAPPGNTKRLAKTAACTDQEARELFELVRPFVPEGDVVSFRVLFRYTLAGTIKKTFCHVDGTSYAGIVYFTLPEHCAGGTSIYRHKATGDIIFNPEHRELYNIQDESQWEIAEEVEMAHNRLVMYPGQMFHALTPVFFGDDITNGRLTQNIFIMRPGDAALNQGS